MTSDSVLELAQPQAPALPAIAAPRRSLALALLCGLWFLLFFAALFAPPLLDDADATHANAARHILTSGDWVTLHVNGIRYLEKAPLPYWLVAISFKLFGFTAFAAHLPQAIAVLLLALLGYTWAQKAFNDRAAFYTGLAILTSAGVFLFTRIFIPEVLLSLLLAASLYSFLQALAPDEAQSTNQAEAKTSRFSPTTHPYLMWTSLALAVLTKGLVAPVFLFGSVFLYLVITGEYRNWRRLKPISGLLLFLAIAAPWHILAGLRNTGGMNGHGFFWFYFVNEHFLRFLGKRIPMDYNKLPGYLFWSLHLVWLFPWSLFAPAAVLASWKLSRQNSTQALEAPNRRSYTYEAPAPEARTFTSRSVLLLAIYSAFVLLFFSFSTNQEYYTFPAYLPLLILTAAALTYAEQVYTDQSGLRRSILGAHAAFTVVSLAVAVTLFLGLWTSRHLPFVPDIGDLLAHRGVGDYTLSMSHIFDLTGPSFAALRLPAEMAAIAFAFGPAIAWILRTRRRHLAATSMLAITSAVFLIAAHIAFIRFNPMLGSADFARTIEQLRQTNQISADTQIMLYGDQAYGSSIPFYLGQQVSLVEGRSTSMLFGSTFPDAPPIFLTNADLASGWGHGSRKLLFVPLERRDVVDQVLGSRQIVIKETSGKALITDRPLDPSSR